MCVKGTNLQIEGEYPHLTGMCQQLIGGNVRYQGEGDLGGEAIENLYFYIANIDCYNVILGTTFMHMQGIVLDVCGHTIFIGGMNGRAIRVFSPDKETQLLQEHEEASGSDGLEATSKEKRAEQPSG
jgi:hypothetical protein